MIDIKEHGGMFGGGANGVKKIQRVASVWDSSSQLEKTFTIEPVNVEKSVIVAQSPNGNTRSGNAHFAGTFISGSQVKIQRGYASSMAEGFRFSVIEFSRAKSKQTGEIISSATKEMDFSFNSVNISKALIYVSANYNFAGSTIEQIPQVEFTSDNTARIYGSSNGQKYFWQIIELF